MKDKKKISVENRKPKPSNLSLENKNRDPKNRKIENTTETRPIG